jgi:CBS domain containing-hemolysin-like protein
MFAIELLVVAAMIAFNNVFAAFEIALASVTLARLNVLTGEGQKGASAGITRTSRLIGLQEEKIIHGFAGVPAHLDTHTRFPLAERKGDPQSIIGYFNFKDIVTHTRLAPHRSSLLKIVRAVPGFAKDTPVSACMERLIRAHVHTTSVHSPLVANSRDGSRKRPSRPQGGDRCQR